MFLLGLLGTGHCIGMCGPLVIAFPGRSERLSVHLLYHAGRLFTYTVAGAVVGGMGAWMASAAAAGGGDPMAAVGRVQVGLSLVAALALLWLGMSRLGLVSEPSWMTAAAFQSLPGYGKVVRAGNDPAPIGMLGAGLLFGLLPCGLSYAAFARALAAGGLFSGAAMLAAFGFGTLPGLLAVGAGTAGLFRRYRPYADPLSGMLMIGMAAELVLDVLSAFGG